MAWTTEQERLVDEIMRPELESRSIAMLFDPALPNAAKNFLRNRLNAKKTLALEDRASLGQHKLDAEAAIDAQIALIDSLLATLS